MTLVRNPVIGQLSPSYDQYYPCHAGEITSSTAFRAYTFFFVCSHFSWQQGSFHAILPFSRSFPLFVYPCNVFCLCSLVCEGVVWVSWRFFFFVIMLHSDDGHFHCDIISWSVMFRSLLGSTLSLELYRISHVQERLSYTVRKKGSP